jgi:hypothetical protein
MAGRSYKPVDLKLRLAELDQRAPHAHRNGLLRMELVGVVRRLADREH